MAAYLDVLQAIGRDRYGSADSMIPHLALVTLTLRVRPGVPLSVLYSRMQEAQKKLRRRKQWVEVVSGGAFAVEVKCKGDGSWNVHLHGVVESRRPVDLYKVEKAGKEKWKCNLVGPKGVLRGDELGSLWREITGDSYVVDISPVLRSKGGLRGAVSYILAYMKKDPEFPSEAEHREFNEVLHGRRTVTLFGTWWGYVMPEKEPFPCPECGEAVWMSEYEVRELGRGPP